MKLISLAAIPIGYYLYRQWADERLRFEGIAWEGHFTEDAEDLDWVKHKGFPQFIELLRDWKIYGGHGGDEYGNCTLYFRTPLFGVIWWYPTGHYQNEVEMTGPGVDRWIDRMYYGGCDDWCKHDETGTN